jgi:uncharacterized protein YcbK (DUF882 family)
MNRVRIRRRELLLASGLCILFGGHAVAAPSVPRRLRLKNVNTGETFDGPYRDATGPIPDAIVDLAYFLRDFHVNKVGPIDVGTLDFVADVLDAVGQTMASVLSGYRTPETNARLRATTLGVAEKSQHLYGRAVDVSMDRLVDAKTVARRMGRGGVGWYPRSHFIHLDTGPPRSWEKDGMGIELLLASAPPNRSDALVEPRRLSPSITSVAARTSTAPGSDLQPCRQTVHGIEIIRGTGCTR